MSLTFYFAPNSTASTVHWTLEELGVPYKAIQVDIGDVADKKAKLGAINPNLKVPVLVHDGVAIYESAAIQIYLGETFGVERDLFPQPGPKRAEAIKWLVWANVTLGEAMSRWQGNTNEQVPADQRNAVAGERGRTDAEQLLGHIDDALAGDDYMLGSTVSIVDFHLASFLQWIGFCGIDMGQFKNIPAWLERCSTREANLKLNAA